MARHLSARSLRQLSYLPTAVLLVCLAACGAASEYEHVRKQDSIAGYEDFLQKNPNASVAPEVRRLLDEKRRKAAAEQAERDKARARVQLEQEGTARRDAERKQALECGERSGTTQSVPVTTLKFAPGLKLQHTTGEVRLGQLAFATSLSFGASTISAFPGDSLVIVELVGTFPDSFKSSIANAIRLEGQDGASILTPQLYIEFGRRPKEASRSPQSLLTISNLVIMSGEKANVPFAPSLGWLAIGTVKSGAAPIFLRLPCVAERVQIPGA